MNEPIGIPPHREGAQVVLDGTTLTVGELITLADGDAVPAVAPEARERAVRSWRTAQRLAASGRLYGRGTGVGAQRSVPVEEDDETAHGLRLLRSHAGGAGVLLPARQVRAMLAVRANQLLAGGSGIQPAFIDALADALRLGVHPAVNEYGGIGTGDLTALAQTGLTLIGERPWTTAETRETAGLGRADPGVTDPGPADPGVADPGLADPGATATATATATASEAKAPGPAEPGATGSREVSGPREATGSAGVADATVSGTRPQGAVSVSSTVADPAGTAVEAVAGASTPARPSSSPADGSRGDGHPAPVQFVMVPVARSAGAPFDAPPGALTQAAPDPRAAGTTAPTPVSRTAGTPGPVVLRAGDALALLSSNALVIGQAALAQGELDVLLRATQAVAALSLAAVSGSPEAYAAPVHALRPYPGAARAASEVRRLLGLADRPRPHAGGRIQDPFGFRAFPQVHGCALDACERLREVVEVEINCPSENPLMDAEAAAAYHHGGFFAAPLGLALDAAVLALLQTAQLSVARLAALGDPGLTGLPAFLATGPVSSSGTMILEYTANSALAELRSSAAPASAGHAVLSRGLEEAASFAGQAARQTLRATDAYATLLACELVCAVRALRVHPEPPRVAALVVATAALPADAQDRPLTDDVTAAVRLLPVLARL
ncbi:aromatic amino acid ammonia-lyase [Streptomyces humidus]|uniref:aromatic amino acid ammonia-lyase n=1 Tax=Streptomyces humidus TaxID=52259 RepID=UPI003325F9BF